MRNFSEPKHTHRDDVRRMLERMVRLGLRREDVPAADAVIAALDELAYERRERVRKAA
jgi:hypothetical protein